MSETANVAATPSPADQRWPWWPLLPLYPYGRRRTLVRELIAGRLWSFEQVQGVWYVAVPIRMLVLRVREGLLLYAPVAPTAEVLSRLRELEERHGRVCTIVLPTASGLEHKLPVPAMARAFPAAQVWVSPKQWSFPLPLPSAWLGFPASRTRVLLSDGVPHGDQLDWLPLGPLDLGLGTFLEIACFDRASGSLLLTDALVAIPPEPPAVFDLDPTPLLFHARERGDEPLLDDPQRRRKGWWRMVLFATYLRPRPLEVPPLGEVLRHCLAPGCRGARAHFGFYPFRWLPGWQEDFEALTPGGRSRLQVAAVLERLVFPRQRPALVAWIRVLAGLKDLRWVVPAHHEAPVASSAAELTALADRIATGEWAPDQGSWQTLAGIDNTLVRLGLVPGETQQSQKPQPW
ncbi:MULTISPECIES: DUF4336 domain-containing protein [unclassified Cyanobium]|uniref:DUF4336 domain-containing protein n=1 Tax=unclassified Cyanobium TaxID=2627006 RepID=UPI0020CC0EA2|nr:MULTISPECIES: DUF4336 domain-containing protein [unclassified Cyanobium]MCP9858555.1 DUF4336 domain-containing protein [Cyanobium sp. Cruz-8H5]MCP9865789.1 DUF4336 domain-containing protein [Cyanobium sp. Cruz-8D1]